MINRISLPQQEVNYNFAEVLPMAYVQAIIESQIMVRDETAQEEKLQVCKMLDSLPTQKRVSYDAVIEIRNRAEPIELGK